MKRNRPHRLTRPNFLSFIAYTLVLFLMATIVANLGPNANSEYRQDWQQHYGTRKMQWVFVNEHGERFDLNAKSEGEHASADRFDYLMPNASRGSQLSGAFVVEGKKEEKPDSTQAISYKKAYATLWHKIEDRSLFISAVFEYLLRGDLVELPEGAVRYVVAMYGLEPQIKKKALDGMSCKTPWGYEIEDGDSVLAYEQRADATFVCNIQRRTCQNGKLSGKFVQKSCDEGKKGNIQTLPFLTLNDEISIDEELQGNVYQQERERKYLENKGYIQPEEPVFEGDKFNIYGKREKNPDPTTIADPARDMIKVEKEKPLEEVKRNYCETPWGERVRSGQFVKAYRFKNGFSDIPCQVQLRLCVDGELEGTYTSPTCKPWMTSREDFRDGYLNGEEPSPLRLMKMLEKDFNADDAMASLDAETAHQMREYLREQE